MNKKVTAALIISSLSHACYHRMRQQQQRKREREQEHQQEKRDKGN